MIAGVAANQPDKARYHRLFGERKARINYAKSDFLDYLLMCLICAGAIAVAYGPLSVLGLAGFALCGFMAVSFAIRHGVAFKVPLLLRRPQDVLFMLAHKVENLPWVYWAALATALLEYWVIMLTPSWPHHTGFMQSMGFALFYLHLGIIVVYRTVSLVDHLRKHALVSKVLLASPWKNAGLVRTNIRYEIVHAYITGLLTHLVLLAPWFFVLSHWQFSVLLAPLACVINLAVHLKFIRLINAWFYRDHWLGHNSELEFVYLHGPHHDAIPAGLIAVAGNGFLEGLMRNIVGYPTPFYNPLVACFAYTVEVKRDIDFHQFIPGIFPTLPLEFRRVGQHSTHHFGHLEPYGFAIKIDQPGLSPEFLSVFQSFPEEFSNSAALDEELTGFKWDNPRHRWFVEICEEHH
ncbi:hypothetical protein KY495_22905 [Massilia sp. PAMC28688]|uniref:hypothetical protein n=1 Tax=Massilia sp. PAMC28688 TaxID=2861283 RepID=UPI001C636780|nr:hypothetical protein [Massilia sp. PAMC28688]QYF93478.1 hypothetical protein KY495_22905 [Massilia sp. PAMC28688]